MPALMGATSGTFTTKDSLKTAVREYNAFPTTTTAKYGSIAGWDVSMITDMSWLFYNLNNFNANISSWDTSKVTTMWAMFSVRSARALATNKP
jgi:surface protein